MLVAEAMPLCAANSGKKYREIKNWQGFRGWEKIKLFY